MKFNFGHGIFVFYIFFVGALGFQLWKSTTIDHSLVSNDYYEKDINFQSTLEARSLANTHPAVLKLKESDRVQLTFKEGYSPSQGSISFFRPNNESLDAKYDFTTNNGKASLPITELIPGRWRATLVYSLNQKQAEQQFVFIVEP